MVQLGVISLPTVHRTRTGHALEQALKGETAAAVLWKSQIDYPVRRSVGMEQQQITRGASSRGSPRNEHMTCHALTQRKNGQHAALEMSALAMHVGSECFQREDST